ncbi:MAG TPA: hypothetical protein VGY31_01895 [Terriglobia bacterium]|nr:hypothetical protein [Terriglobia bacterium]
MKARGRWALFCIIRAVTLVVGVHLQFPDSFQDLRLGDDPFASSDSTNAFTVNIFE